MAEPLIRLAVWASGQGTNAENLIRYFKSHPRIRVALVVCNKPEAPVLAKASSLKVPTMLVGKESWRQEQDILNQLQAFQIDAMVLAGFLWRIPEYLLQAYPNRIVNVHPSLLPEFGGKGMYGERVHQAVLESGRTESGITIHLVNDSYDEGTALATFRCPVKPNDTAHTLAERIHTLEQAHLPPIVEQWVLTEVGP
ncbi:MAG: phosphoribosylglycinamide formyltransferase [Sphingomonadales bacterium]|nr:phosphoribosylglycinamide formyltransferase [Sphingomonadales bacterium]